MDIPENVNESQSQLWTMYHPWDLFPKSIILKAFTSTVYIKYNLLKFAVFLRNAALNNSVTGKSERMI